MKIFLNKSLTVFMAVVIMLGFSGISATIHKCGHSGKTYLLFYDSDIDCLYDCDNELVCNECSNHKSNETNSICKDAIALSSESCDNEDISSNCLTNISCCTEKTLEYLIEIPSIIHSTENLKLIRTVNIIYFNKLIDIKNVCFCESLKETEIIIKKPIQNVLSFIHYFSSNLIDEDYSTYNFS